MIGIPNHLLDIADAELSPSAAPARILSGKPTCRERVILDTGALEVGIWEVTPGVFDSVKNDVGEVIHFVSGAGRIEHADGNVSPIAPGVVIALQPGWSGRWHVDQTARKLYVIYSAPVAQA